MMFQLHHYVAAFNDTDPPNALEDDQCTVAENVEFFSSMLGERRNGCGPLTITGSGLSNEAGVGHISQWFPTNDMTAPEFFAVGVTNGVSATVAKRSATGTWSTIVPTDALNTSVPDVYGITTQALSDKLFFSYRSAQNRLHVYDGTTIRRAGLAAPAAPTAANNGVGTYRKTRYFRVRYTIQSGSTVLVRSEPSATLTFAPSGTGLVARITKPATISEGETHWEVEASIDNSNFYRIASVLVATTTYDDTLTLASLITATGIPTPTGYVQLSDAAATLALTGGGGVSLGTYSNGVTFPLHGWVGYRHFGGGVKSWSDEDVKYASFHTELGGSAEWNAAVGEAVTRGLTPTNGRTKQTYYDTGTQCNSIPKAALEGGLITGDVFFASADVATALEKAVGTFKNYADNGTLSEKIGEYLTLPSAKYIAVDGDRLLFAGHWTDATLQSQVGWTPVSNDPGIGNSERLPLSVNNTLKLDAVEGGGITGISATGNGTWYVFKWTQIYKFVRTGNLQQAYDVLTISKTRGAIPGSIVNGVDDLGSTCVYFIDPNVGPSRLGPGGLKTVVGVRGTRKKFNLQAATVPCRGLFYNAKQQVHWWLAIDGSDTPNLKLILQVNRIKESSGVETGTIGGGWSTATGRITQALSVAMFTEVVSIAGVVSLSTRPFIGLTSPDFIQRCDTESTDAGTTYIAKVRTKPFLVAGLLNKWGAMRGALFATPNASLSVTIKFIRDMGLETNSVTTTLTASGSESHVIKRFDALSMSNATMLQVEISD